MKSQGIRQGYRNSWVLKTSLLISVFVWLFLVAKAWSSEEYNFKWLDPDKKVYVLQNRKYVKEGHIEIAFLPGIGISNPYRDHFVFEGRVSYNFTEDWGLEGFVNYGLNKENSNYTALRGASPNASPVIRELNLEGGGLVKWSPWYAKINVFNSILFFDWYFTAGAGMINGLLEVPKSSTVSQVFSEQYFAGFFGTGHEFHLSQEFLVRLDYTYALYRAPLFGVSGDQTFFSSSVFKAGVGLRL